MKVEKKFINLTNHPTAKWSDGQLGAARKLGERIVDMIFPNIPPQASESEVYSLASKYAKDIMSLAPKRTVTGYFQDSHSPAGPDKFEQTVIASDAVTVHLMGESTFCAFLIDALKNKGFEGKVVVSTTERKVVEKDGVKTSVFEFVQFRQTYPVDVPELHGDAPGE